jgi:plastocyanin
MGRSVSWGAVVRASAALSSLIALGRGVVQLDRESIAIGVALGAATAFTFAAKPLVRRIGWIAAAALFVNQAAWMVVATLSLTSAAPSVLGAAVPVVLAVAAVVGLAASAARARGAGDRGAQPSALGAVAVALVLVVAVPVAGAGAVKARPFDLRVNTSDLAFHPTRLQAHAGDVGVVVHNEDLFWHTFTVNQTNQSVSVPTGGTKRLVLEKLPPGTYDFVCAIPGHEGAGMKGVLVVQ